MNNEKIKSVVAYIFGIIGGLIILLMKDTEKNTRIHAAQSIVIFLGYYIINVIYSWIPFVIPHFELVLMAVYIMVVIVGIIKVANSSEPEIPIVGGLAVSFFKKQIEK